MLNLCNSPAYSFGFTTMRARFLVTLLLTFLSFGHLLRQRPIHPNVGEANSTSRNCFIAEDTRTVPYGFAFNTKIPEGSVCGPVSCNVHRFMNSGLAKLVGVDENDGKCHCTLSGKKLFAIKRFKTCDVEQCWEQLSIVMSIAKRKEHKKAFGAPDFLSSHNHWTATCERGTSIVTTPSEALKKLREHGDHKEADQIEHFVEVEKVEDEELPKIVRMDEDDEPELDDESHDGDGALDTLPKGLEEGVDFSICPPKVVWDFHPDKPRCHEVPSMKYCYTECCWSYLDEAQQAHALKLALKRKRQ